MREKQGPVSVYNADIVDQAKANLDFIVEQTPNIHREEALLKLIFDLLPAKGLYDDDGNLKNDSVNSVSQSDGGFKEGLSGLPALVVGNPVFDGNDAQINSGFSDNTEGPKILSKKEILEELVSYDTGGKSTVDEEVYFERTRYKLARLSLVFNKSVLNFLFKQIRNDEDFDSFIKHIRSGDIPLCLISDDETRRIKAFFDYKKAPTNTKQYPENPPPLPAVARMIQRYKKDESLDEILGSLQTEEPYASELFSETINYQIVSVDDTDDIPGTLKDVVSSP